MVHVITPLVELGAEERVGLEPVLVQRFEAIDRAVVVDEMRDGGPQLIGRMEIVDPVVLGEIVAQLRPEPLQVASAMPSTVAPASRKRRV